MRLTEHLKGIEVFVTTADAGSFTAAAMQLNLSTSAVSKGVARLEARLGTRLFERTTRSLALTDSGEAFYRTCTRILAELEEAETVLTAQRQEPAGRLRIDVPVTFGKQHVLPLLLNFTEHNPRLRLHASFTDRFVDLIEEGIDLAVRIGSVEQLPNLLAHQQLGQERLIFCAAPQYLGQHLEIQHSHELDQLDCILYGRADGSVSPWMFSGPNGQIERRTMNGRITVGSGEAQVQAVKGGYGISQLATWMIRDELQRGELVQIMPHLTTPGLAVHLIWPRSRQLLPKVDLMLRLLSQHLTPLFLDHN
ncbi:MULTISPECIES: LysR substrate-binding domain-containing protein [unclassified Pseudomonas]|uniref:LysR substrate-binding domain-containing protein n=1 Tax=unclassified Pseudomonas TaxID=196821 RepID=UPI00244B9353|nr:MULTISPECIES: LysR substrate-binding domain-containing protein [unclassified Pseudomonas]MDH0300965.1 LysR substrate-binding domain-containing protein [Pseudomonas sp. GD04091]MDH1983503.1 LysR substrate-binding domain-containing protein [Pseudomonas sp. GD03689]